MSKLVVVSEIDNLKYLHTQGIKPSEFITDFEVFKSRSSIYRDVIVLFVLAGTCNFSRRKSVELISILKEREESIHDSGIRSVFVVSDAYQPLINGYFKFQNNFSRLDYYSGYKLKQKDYKLFDKLRYEACDSPVLYLKKEHTGDVDEIRQRIHSKNREDDELIPLIKSPDVSKS